MVNIHEGRIIAGFLIISVVIWFPLWLIGWFFEKIGVIEIITTKPCKKEDIQ